MILSTLKIQISLLLLLAGLTSCDKDDDTTTELTKGYAVGNVVDTKGQAMMGVTIVLDNTLIPNSNLVGTTDTQGNYRVKTSDVSSTYVAYAEIERTYNGRHYRLELKPDQTAAFAGVDGAVRNFRWVLSGRNAHNPDRFYGGTVSIDKDITSQVYDHENLEFTFTPAGPLIDGSQGQVLTRSLDPEFGNELRGVPIGRYRITAVYKPTGQTIKLRNRFNGSYATDGSVTLDFYGSSGPLACTNCMGLEYKE